MEAAEITASKTDVLFKRILLQCESFLRCFAGRPYMLVCTRARRVCIIAELRLHMHAFSFKNQNAYLF